MLCRQCTYDSIYSFISAYLPTWPIHRCQQTKRRSTFEKGDFLAFEFFAKFLGTKTFSKIFQNLQLIDFATWWALKKIAFIIWSTEFKAVVNRANEIDIGYKKLNGAFRAHS